MNRHEYGEAKSNYTTIYSTEVTDNGNIFFLTGAIFVCMQTKSECI